MEITLDTDLKKKYKVVLEWVEIGGRLEADRAKIPGGWLVSVGIGNGGGVTFVPDPNHEWQ